jgi:drug/metabolite transporter (DMT)-like permease
VFITGVNVGVIAALISACTSTAKDLVSKLVSGRVHPDVSTFASFAYALPFYLVIMVGLTLWGDETLAFSRTFFMLVVLRGISDVCAEGCKMRAFSHGDVSLVSGLLSLSPLVLVVLSPLITGDPVSSRELLAIGCIVGGSLLLVRRDKTSGRVAQPIAILYALAGSFAFALNTCLDRLAVGHGGPVLSAFSMTLCAALLTLPLLFRRPGSVVELRTNTRQFLLRGFFETVFMVAKMIALVGLSAHVVVGLTRMSMLLTVIVGGVMFKEGDRVRRIVGSSIMYGGLLLLVL